MKYAQVADRIEMACYGSKKFSDGKISESGHFVSSMNTTNNTVHDRDSVDGLSILDASQEKSIAWRCISSNDWSNPSSKQKMKYVLRWNLKK